MIDSNAGDRGKGTFGIDLGTCSCRTVFAKDGDSEVVWNRFSEGRMPVFLQNAYLHSTSLKNKDRQASDALFTGIKQQIGMRETVTIDSSETSVHQSLRNIFSAVKEDAGNVLSSEDYRTVVTIPSCFMEKQRALVRRAADEARLCDVHLLDESVAALLETPDLKEGSTVLVYALGGGVFTASLFRIMHGAPNALGHEGDPQLGGNDFDSQIIKHIFDQAGVSSVHFHEYSTSIKKLRELLERVKYGLSKRESMEFEIDFSDFITFDEKGDHPIPQQITFTRREFERIISPFVCRTIALVDKLLKSVGVGQEKIDRVAFLGGSTRIPFIENAVRTKFGKESVRISDGAVAKGAATYGSQILFSRKKEDVQPVDQSQSVPDVEIALDGERQSDTPGEQFELAESFFASHAKSHWIRGEKEKAITILETLKGELPAYISRMCGIVGKELVQEKEYKSALQIFEKGLSLDSNNAELRWDYHHACNYRANELIQKGDLHDALAVIKKGLQLVPNCKTCSQMYQRIEREINKIRFQQPSSKSQKGRRRK